MKDAYATLHAHFYQPPRENPWLEKIEIQEEARPFHDWNERIAAECYTPLGAARMVDRSERIVAIRNCYEEISFNAGPTLMAWLERHAPGTYARILEADRASVTRWGHGNAIAQAYNHMILPLADPRDARTQIRWGIADFRHRFGRDPEAIWLPETAVDRATLGLLAEAGMKFAILAPSQATRVRPLDAKGGGPWTDVSKGTIDPTRPYRCRLENGRTIDLFCYDGPISHAVSFEGILQDPPVLAERLALGYREDRGRPQLIHIATDGEVYGHHVRQGERALAYTLARGARERGLTLTNYGAFLERHPPTWEVEIQDGTAWSCPHGLDRWRDDCGCQTGGRTGWNQRWRRPLREALDHLRDELAALYEKEAAPLLRDPWEARDAYIEVILDRSPSSVDRFLAARARAPLDAEGRVRALQMLETQRHAMLMFTSCGWFFADLSGIETLQVLQYAARAIELAAQWAQRDLEGPFLKILSTATGNLPGHPDGREIYLKHVKPRAVGFERVLANRGMASLLEGRPNPELESDQTFEFRPIDELHHVSSKVRLAMGRVTVRCRITGAEQTAEYAACSSDGTQVVCGVRPAGEPSRYESQRATLLGLVGDPDAILAQIREAWTPVFGFNDLFEENARRLLGRLLETELEEYREVYRAIFHRGHRLLLAVREMEIEIPAVYQVAAEYILTAELQREASRLRSGEEHEPLQRIRGTLREAARWGCRLDRSMLRSVFSRWLEDRVQALIEEPVPERAVEVEKVLHLAAELEVPLDLIDPQERFYHSLEGAGHLDPGVSGPLLQIAQALYFSRQWAESRLRGRAGSSTGPAARQS